jgi:uncharacterized membrane protein
MTAESDQATDGEQLALGEPRWPIGLAICFLLAITVVFDLVVPHRETVGTVWLMPAIGGALLVVLLAADPGSVKRRARWLRRVSIVLLTTLAAAAVYLTVVLSIELIAGENVASFGDELLASGALIWLGNNVIFALFYWQFDGGGALARAQYPRQHPDFAFPQHQNPELAPPGWRPRFGDYLYLGLTTATAFSPTDVMPFAPWAKITMGLQSLISLVVFTLVIATAVNVLS